MFPYHYGSYATERQVKPSLLVAVSIPLWFLRNISTARVGSLLACFHTTMVLTQPPPTEKWEALMSAFPYHYGSYATLGVRIERLQKFLSFPYHYGSYATYDWQEETRRPHQFPYHYGSYATYGGGRTKGAKAKFPYHYGSYATKIPIVIHSGLTKFPYHYGSYATCAGECHLPVLVQVSIPLWFLRNQRPLVHKREPVRFHTTMVLTQLCLTEEGKIPTRFPYHYGSYATKEWPGIFIGFEIVSIPLWFLRNV